MDYVRKGHKNSNDKSWHHKEKYKGYLLVQNTSLLPTRDPHLRTHTHRAALPAGWGLSAPPAAPLTSLPRCHSRCWARGKPASASIRAFTSPTAAEGGSSKVLQPRQSWRTVTRASLQQRDRHQLSRDPQRPAPATTLRLLSLLLGGPGYRDVRAGACPTLTREAAAGPASGAGSRSAALPRPLLSPALPCPALPCHPAPPPLTCPLRHTKDR